MKLTKRSGATIAAAAAAMMISGAVVAPVSAAEKGDVHCYNVNACKGKTGCATASNACKGQNACKGKGWVAMSKDACDAIGGSTKAKK